MKEETNVMRESEKPREAVIMLIYNGQREVLFARRSMDRRFLPGVWSLPSGHVEEGESFEQAVIREAQEELGIQVQKMDFVETISEPSGDNTKIHLINIFPEFYQGIPRIVSNEFDVLMWMKLEDFYDRFIDEEIGSTLRHLRPRFQKNPNKKGL